MKQDQEVQISLQHQNERLNQLLEFERKRLQIQKDVANELRYKNLFLASRSRELTKRKLTPLLSPRSVMIGDAAGFSDFYGHIDGELLEEHVTLCESLENADINFWSTVACTNKHELYEGKSQ